MNDIMVNVLAIVEHALSSGELPEGMSKGKAEYIAGVVREGVKAYGANTSDTVEIH